MSHRTTNAADFNDRDFWSKLGGCFMAAGREVVLAALKALCVLKSPATQVWAKSTLVGALACVISPLDAIPDFIPVLGYSDDQGVLLTALHTVGEYVSPAIVRDAETTLARWFN